LDKSYKDVGAAYDVLNQNLNFMLASVVVGMVLEHYGLNPESEEAELVEELGNLPERLEDPSETKDS
jgi:hypothetical protein